MGHLKRHIYLTLTGFQCSFDEDLCGFTQRTDDRFDWTRRNGRTSSQGTGPNSDHTTGKGEQSQ